MRTDPAHPILDRLAIGGGVVAAATILADLTIARGSLSNLVPIAAWTVSIVCVSLIGDGRKDRSERLRAEAPQHGLRFLTGDHAGLPRTIPWRLVPGGHASARNVMEGSVGDRPLYVFESSVVEDERWWDDEPSIDRLTVCCLRLPGPLPTFHVEVGRLTARQREGWAKPIVDVTAGRRPSVRTDPLPPVARGAVFHSEMIEWLATSVRAYQIRVEGEWMSCFALGTHDPAEAIGVACGFVDRIRGEAFSRS